MNIIIILVAVVAFIVSLIFSTRLQTAVFQTLQLAGVIAQGVWNRVAPGIAGVANSVAGAIPTVRGMFMTILRTAWRVARVALIALLVIWALNLIIFWGVGIEIGAPWCGFALGILIPLASILYILRGIPGIGRATQIPRWVTTAVIVLALPYFVIGSWSPEVLSGIDYWAADKKQTVADMFYRACFKSESKVGVFATLPEETVVYNDKGKALWRLPKNYRIMVMDLKGYPKTSRVEGMTMIMMQNKYGDFVNGNKVFVPSNKIQM